MAEGSFQRIPYLIVFDEVSAFKDTYGGAIGKVAVEAMHLRPDVPSDSVVIFSHPIGGGSWLPLVSNLARMGVHTIYCNTRYRGNETALIMERAVMDFGACIRHAREKLGYKKVYLGGWSGGGAQSLFYQAEAQDPRVTHTPAGDPYDLTAAGFVQTARYIGADTLELNLDPSAGSVYFNESRMGRAGDLVPTWIEEILGS